MNVGEKNEVDEVGGVAELGAFCNFSGFLRWGVKDAFGKTVFPKYVVGDVTDFGVAVGVHRVGIEIW